MCGRFYVDADMEREIGDILWEIEQELWEAAGIKRGGRAFDLKTGDICPGQEALVLYAANGGKREGVSRLGCGSSPGLQTDSENGALYGTTRYAGGRIRTGVLRWGYQAAGKKNLLFNARSETVKSRPAFSHDYETHRCVVPARKFYEWKTLSGKEKEKYDFYVPGQALYLAGLYHKEEGQDRFTILTRQAEGCMVGIHDRMPVILPPGEIGSWLLCGPETDRLLIGNCGMLQRKRSGGEEYRQLSLF